MVQNTLEGTFYQALYNLGAVGDKDEWIIF